MRESRRPPFFQSWVPDVSYDVRDSFLFGSTEDVTYETNKTNVTYGTDGNDMMIEIFILTKIAFYVQI